MRPSSFALAAARLALVSAPAGDPSRKMPTATTASDAIARRAMLKLDLPPTEAISLPEARGYVNRARASLSLEPCECKHSHWFGTPALRVERRLAVRAGDLYLASVSGRP